MLHVAVFTGVQCCMWLYSHVCNVECGCIHTCVVLKVAIFTLCDVEFGYIHTCQLLSVAVFTRM